MENNEDLKKILELLGEAYGRLKAYLGGTNQKSEEETAPQTEMLI